LCRVVLLKGISAHRARFVDTNLNLSMVHNSSMSGRPKLSEEEFKWLVSQCNSRAELRRRSGLSRWTLGRMAARYGVDLATVFDPSATQLQSTSGHAEESLQAVECTVGSALVDRPKPELKRNIFGLSAADFAGPCHGDVGQISPVVGPNAMVSKLWRLKGYR
jgi:hypothetical protein